MGAIAAAVLTASGAPAAGLEFCLRDVTEAELSRMDIVTQQDKNHVRRRATRELVISTEFPPGPGRAEITRRDFRIVEDNGAVTILQRLNYGDDSVGWIGFHYLGDGWLYARGAQYHALVRVIRQDGEWVLTDNIRVKAKPEASLFVRLLARLLVDRDQIKRDRLTGMVHKTERSFQRILFSPAIGVMLFLEDGERLRNGAFVPIGEGGRLSYHGDIAEAGAALLSDLDRGGLFAYDGETLWPVAGPAEGGGGLIQPEGSDRMFLRSDHRLFEIRGDIPGNLRSVELTPEVIKSPGAWYSPVVMEGGHVLFVTSSGVFHIDGDASIPVMTPDAGDLIYGPKDAYRLADGQLIITTKRAGESGGWRTRLLSICG